MSILALRMDTYSLAQLKVIRKWWAKIPPNAQTKLLTTARSLASSQLAGPVLSLAPPQNCSPASVGRFTSLAQQWQRLSKSRRGDLLVAILAAANDPEAAI